MTRDLRKDPMPGDVLLVNGETVEVVAVGAVAFKIEALEYMGAMTPAEWQEYTANAKMKPTPETDGLP